MSAGGSARREPPGQMRTEVPASGTAPALTVISAGREVEQGARSVLILAEGLFRFDVVPHGDSVQAILRNLSPEPAAEMRYGPVGGSTDLLGGPHELTAPSTSRFGGEVVIVGSDGEEWPVAKLLVGSISHLERGVTTFTAQATLL
jgi:hypothetical protein